MLPSAARILSTLAILIIICCGSQAAINEFGKLYPLTDNTGFYLTPNEPYHADFGFKFSTDTAQGLYSVDVMDTKSYENYPKLNVENATQLQLFGMYSLNLTQAKYGFGNSTLFMYLSYASGVFNLIPNSMRLMLFSVIQKSFVPIPNQERGLVDVRYSNNSIFDLAISSSYNSSFIYFGFFGVKKEQTLDLGQSEWVTISYPQVVKYKMNQLNQTLNVFYYDPLSKVVHQPHFYRAYFVNDAISALELPSTDYVVLHRFTIVGAEDQNPSQPEYRGIGVPNFIFTYDSNLGFSNYMGNKIKINESSLTCAYQLQNTQVLSLKEGTAIVDPQTQQVTCIWYGSSSSSIETIAIIAKSSHDYTTIIIAVTISIGGTLLLIVFTVVATLLSYFIWRRRQKRRYQTF
ncbi:hypothetical protein FDP41_006525 [Naegleria fowleri]|uniref:Transmembrane protein n=1 Tax=Naegleria fowleri TaxID=5763 RepID=A0A6A5B830_NAEFO|nr:uncharacterized protein FDP41_006525 [Naegleria fowleri]KAF0974493.1 hypothetical protein FDP41_006525 [Naegleria fowleri]CAG4716986.1 unnamed protein product [Naegleria fowleri]